jgi:MFS transporter, SHS family, lactate transporter
MLGNQYNFDSNSVTVTQVVANLGAMTGGTVIGYCSQIFGRRFSIIFISVIGGALLYPYTFTSSKAVVSTVSSPVLPLTFPFGDLEADLWRQTQGCPGFLRTILCARSLGSYPNSSYGVISRVVPDIRCWYLISTWKSGVVRLFNYRSHNRRAIPASSQEQCS